MAKNPIGYRIARYRVLAGMTQQQLGDAIGVTKGCISQLEGGRTPLTNINRIDAIAYALGVSRQDLEGRPYPPTAGTDLVTYQVVPQVRAALDEPDDPDDPRPLDQLTLAADRAMAARMSCDMAALGQHLPGLIADTRLLWFDRGDRAAGELLVQAAVTGSLALKSAGWIDLGIRLAELADNVATSLGDPVCIAAARFAVAQSALSNGARRRSARLATDGAADLDRLTRTRLPDRVLNDAMAWLGMLHLHAALSVAGLPNADPADANAHLDAAAAAAGHVTGDPWRMEFSRANVGTWRVGVALENGEPERAPELARLVDPNQLVTPQRRSRLYLDSGRGLFIAGRTGDAVTALLAADREAPGDLRNRAAVVEIVSHLVQQSRVRGGSDQLRDLAVRVGVDPVEPVPA